jgi:hypothetical protein
MKKIYTLMGIIGTLLFSNDALSQFPNPYCAEAFSNSVEPITKVVFAGINNPSSATVGGTAHEDFTAITGTVRKGQSYTFTAEGNSDGNFANFYSVFIDFNNDGDFGDAGEGFAIDYIINSTGLDGKQATSTIAIPFSAATGNTRMRVVKKYSSTVTYPSTCNTAGYGQAEDYTLNILAAFTNDAEIVNAYGYGKYLANHNQVITARVRNSGSATLTNLPVTLNVTGATTFTDTKLITINSGDSATVTFNAFRGPSGVNNIAVSVPSDEAVSNNSALITQTITTKTVSTATSTTPDGGVGNNTPTSFAIRFNAGTGSMTVDQLLLYFPASSTGQPVTAAIHDASGAGGTPGATALWTSSSFNTNGANVTLSPSPAVPVVGDFFVVINQTGTTNIGYGYQAQYPLQPATYYLKTSGSWTDMGAPGFDLDFRPMVDVRFDQGTMPVTLISFKGEQKNEGNLLYWSTSTETNNKGFELERSADGKSFSKIIFVASKAENGNSNSQLSYSFNDEKPFAGTNYYRLKQVDKDGKFSYWDIVVLKNKIADFRISSLYPNPAKTEVRMVINATNAGRATVVVTDLTGKVISQIPTQLMVGENIQQINVQSLATGTYMVKVIANSGLETAVQRFVKN